MSRSFLWLIVALLLVGCSRSASSEAIVVGHVAPFSGPDRTIGEHGRQGIVLAVEEVNNDGDKINGQRVEVHHADDHGVAASAGDEAATLVSLTRAVGLLGGTNSAAAEQIARVAQSRGVPFVTPSPLTMPGPTAMVFSTSPSPARLGRALARFAGGEQKVKHVVVLVDTRSALCTGVVAGFENELTLEWEQQVAHYGYENEAALAELPGRIAKAKPDAVVIASSAADFAKLRDGLAGAEVKAAILFAGEESAWPTILAQPDGGKDVYAVTTFATDGLTPHGQEFARKYQERFHEAPDLYAASAYDGARLLFEAMRKAKSSKPEDVRKALPELGTFETLTGPLTLDRDDHGAPPPLRGAAPGGAAEGCQTVRSRPEMMSTRLLLCVTGNGTLRCPVTSPPAGRPSMKQMAPPIFPPPVTLDEGDGPNRVQFRLWQIALTALTVLVTAWFCTFGWVPAILALLVAKHVLVAILVMGIGVDQQRA